MHKPSPLLSEKTLQFIICVANKIKDYPNDSTSLLCNSLFFVDYASYFKRGQPISNLSYFKEKEGVAPKAEILSALDVLRNQSCEPDMSRFEQDEIQLINDVLEKLSTKSNEISKQVKSLLGWEVAEDNEEIPLYTFQYNDKDDLLNVNPQLASKAIKE